MRIGTMKSLTTAIVTALFATGAAATDLYQGFAAGNPDLRAVPFKASDIAGVQPGVGDSVDRYQGFADGNPDLFRVNATDRGYVEHEAPDIYRGLSGGNPDL
jgi:hypothetical protein